MTKSRKNLLVGAGLVAGIAADQIIDPHRGMIGHAIVLLSAGGLVAALLEVSFRWLGRKKTPGPPAG
jgi:hypothetical protein